MTERLTIGFLPLVDACLPILAHEHGFAEEEGVALTFQRDGSGPRCSTGALRAQRCSP